jgi:glycosyltransferase involved in cell wall biosynthesis
MSGAGLSGAEMCLLHLIDGINRIGKNSLSVLNTEEGILNNKLRQLGVTVYIQPSIYIKRIYRIREILQLIKNIYAFKKIINKERPDIVHAFTLPLARRILLLKKIGIKTPIVGTTHDTPTIDLFGKRKMVLYTKCVNKYYLKLISVSHATKNVVISNGINEDKVIVIHNGIPVESIKNQTSKTNEFVIGIFGRVVFGKGHHIILDAINILKNDIPKLKCYIVGEPPSDVSGSMSYYESLKSRVVEFGIEKNIEFVNWVDGLDDYYNRLDVYVLSSVTYDSFPTVNLEAMQHKLPVIATSIGGSKEQIIDGVTGFIIEPENPAILANKILFFYNNPNEAKKMGENGYIRVTKEFNMQKYVDRHLSLYRDCLNHKYKI